MAIWLPAAILIVCSPSGAQQRRALPDDIAVQRDVVYGRGGSTDLKLDVYRSTAERKGSRPAVVFIHGGGWRSGSRSGPNPLVYELAQKGFVSFSIDYRLVPAATFPAQIEDCKCAVRYIRAHAKDFGVDPKRIGVWGTSAGGHLAALLGSSGGVKELEGQGGWGDHDSRVQAVVSCFGPTDLNTILEQRGQTGMPNAEVALIGGAPSDKKELARLASPVSFVSRDDPPFMFLHGGADRLVPSAQSQEMHDLLVKAGVKSEIHIFPGILHAMAPEGGRLLVDFFVKVLRS